jgi:F-type H+-transporting ATPase subunit b
VSFAPRSVRSRFAGAPALVLPVPLQSLAQEGAEHAGEVLGLPAWLWQLANLVLFLGVLVYFIARPLAEAFRKRQLDVEERLKLARERRTEAARFEAEIHERMTRLEREVAQIRSQGAADGEAEKRALIERAGQEAERVRQSSQEEIERRLTAAKLQLRAVASDLAASAATKLLSREITDEDRRRLLNDSVARLKDAQ